MRILTFIFSIAFFHIHCLAQGPFAPPVGAIGTRALHADSSVFTHWASVVELNRGFMNIANPSAGLVNSGSSLNALGKAGDGKVVSLGDSGFITLTFDVNIQNVNGPDFAVFENGFDDEFLELAFVEVSSNGINFFRLPAQSLTDTINQVGSFGTTDATDIYNLAGKYRGGYGTPFDLDDLSDTDLDFNKVKYIRIVDVIGSLNSNYASYDSKGNKVNDPWPTEFPSSGFDLDGVGLINQPTSGIDDQIGLISIDVYPNPTSGIINVSYDLSEGSYWSIVDLNGREIWDNYERQSTGLKRINTVDIGMSPGFYWLKIYSNSEYGVKQIVIN